MDRQTAELLDALKHPGGAFMLHLLGGPATEAQLIAEAASVLPLDQSTGNRRLALLQRRGLVTQEAGKRRAPGRRWVAALPTETSALLDAALGLSEAIAEQEQHARESARQRARRESGSHRLRDLGGGAG
jgi:hypothetical protein